MNVNPCPSCAEQAPLAKESLQTGKLQLIADEATATVSTRCCRTSKHGLQTGQPQHLPHMSSRITRGREERGLMPSTAVQSLLSEHPLACTSRAHPRIHTGVSQTSFLERPSGAHPYAASRSSHHLRSVCVGSDGFIAHTLCPSHSELTHSGVPHAHPKGTHTHAQASSSVSPKD